MGKHTLRLGESGQTINLDKKKHPLQQGENKCSPPSPGVETTHKKVMQGGLCGRTP